MNTNLKWASAVILMVCSGGLLLAAGGGCELAVNLDLSLVDAGTPSDSCAICVDGMVITDPDGNTEIVPFDAGADAAPIEAATDALAE